MGVGSGFKGIRLLWCTPVVFRILDLDDPTDNSVGFRVQAFRV